MLNLPMVITPALWAPELAGTGYEVSVVDISMYGTCYSSFDLSSIYAVKYHLTTHIRLYQPSFLISTIPGPHYRFPAFSDLPVI